MIIVTLVFFSPSFLRALCFSRSASLKHYYLNQLDTPDYDRPYIYPGTYSSDTLTDAFMHGYE